MIRFLRTLLFLTPLVAGCGSAFAFNEPEDFKGVKWGASRDEAKSIIHTLWSDRGVKSGAEFGRIFDTRTAANGLGSMWFWDDIGIAKNVHTVMYFSADKFVAVELTFPSGFFSMIEGAFATRYGEPDKTDESETSNASGGKFVNKTSRWIGKGLGATIIKYFTKVTHGWALISTPEFDKLKDEESRQRVRDAAKDL